MVPVKMNVLAPVRIAVVPVVRMNAVAQYSDLWGVIDDE